MPAIFKLIAGMARSYKPIFHQSCGGDYSSAGTGRGLRSSPTAT